MHTQDLDALQRLNDGFIASVRNSDTKWFEANLAEDFVNGNADGTFSDRAAFIASIARPCPLSDLRAEDVRVRLLGEFAIIHGRTVYKKANGAATAGRYTDVYARRDGRWVCVSADVLRG